MLFVGNEKNFIHLMAFRDNRIVFAFLGISTLIVFLQTKGLGLKLSLSEVLKTSSPNID